MTTTYQGSSTYNIKLSGIYTCDITIQDVAIAICDKIEKVIINVGRKILYFIEYIAHFFTRKMRLKYSLRTIHGR
jgi:hypothetical protein